ncbi:hypothetical protein ANMWB30_33380 [Arthrobacter sp. MWB30]|nr:hypothetical protein ANMWB30_33380 [Arthrobacter sp. MWB30]
MEWPGARKRSTARNSKRLLWETSYPEELCDVNNTDKSISLLGSGIDRHSSTHLR